VRRFDRRLPYAEVEAAEAKQTTMRNGHEEHETADRLFIKGSDLEDEGKIYRAIKAYASAARMGHVCAMSNLGNLLDDKIKPPRPKEAVYWYKRAIRLKHSVAAWNLAMHYRNVGKRRWYIHWLQVAAKMGDPEAKAELRKLKK